MLQDKQNKLIKDEKLESINYKSLIEDSATKKTIKII